MDEVKLEHQASVDSCQHLYCLPCISKWVDEVENSCPLCKGKIHKVMHKDMLGFDKTKLVSDKVQEAPEVDDEIVCQVCTQQIRYEDFQYRPNVRYSDNFATLCELCVEQAVHVKCMSLT